MGEKTDFVSNKWLSDEEILTLGIKPKQVDLYRRKYYFESFGIASWIDKLREHTFYTDYIPLTALEGTTMLQFMREDKNFDNIIEHPNIKNLIEKIDLKIQSNEKFSNGVFIKLSTRSPKDVPVYDYDNERLKSLIKYEIEKKIHFARQNNHQTWSFIKATNKFMKVLNGKEAMELILKSSRVREDLSGMLNFGDEFFKCDIIVREWVDEVSERPEYEFRGFANNYKLNALTMYFCFAYSEELVRRKKEIQELILNFYESIKHLIEPTAYVIDFYVMSDNTIKIIEMNPFQTGAGGGLFNWREHRELFLNGPFEFRILEEIPKGVEIPDRWNRWILSEYPANKDWMRVVYLISCVIIILFSIYYFKVK